MRILLLSFVGSLLAGCTEPPPPKPSPCRYVAVDRSPAKQVYKPSLPRAG